MIRDAAISSWARVIWAMDRTPRIRCLIARSCAAIWPSRLTSADSALSARTLLAGIPLRPADTPGQCFLVDVFLVGRLDRLILDQQAAPADFEALAELVDRVLEPTGGVVGQVTGLPDRVVQAPLLALHEVEELPLEPVYVANRHIIQVALGAHPDRDDLAFHRERAVLRLLEQLGQPCAPVQLGP